MCLKNAFKDGHDVECPILYSIQSIPGNSYLNQLVLKWFLKECSKVDVQTFCLLLSTLDKMTTTRFNENRRIKSGNFSTAYFMKTFKTTTQNLFYFHGVAVEIVEYLILSGFTIPDYCITTVGASIVHMLNILHSNCQKLFVYNPSVPFITKENESHPIAYGLYPSMGLFNHSCDPNVKPSGLLSDKIRVLKAIRPIPKGSEVTIVFLS